MKLQNITILLNIFIIILLGCDRPKSNIGGTTKKNPVQIEQKEKYYDEKVFNSLDKKELLKRLFDNPTIDTTGMAIWKPNYYERMQYNVSYDKMCHTSIDTILYFIDSQKRKCAAFIFGTYHYGRDCIDSAKIGMGDCHFCGTPIGIALLFENNEKKWELYLFKKAFTSLGYFGEYKTGREDAGKIMLKQFGDKWTCLSLTQGVGGNMGEFSGYENIYSIEQYQLGGFPNNTLSCVFSYNYYFEYTSIDEKIKTKENSVMKVLIKKDNYYDIDLVVTKNGKTKTEHYKYSDDYDRYIEK